MSIDDVHGAGTRRFPSGESSRRLAQVFSGATPLLRRVRLAWLTRRRRRERACLRCGDVAVGVCTACAARTCARCATPSIETGYAAILCIGCAGGAPAPRLRPLVTSPADLFRQGALAILAGAAVMAALAAHADGWPAAARLFFGLFHPAVLFGLVPLAFLLGAAIRALRRITGR